MMAYVECMMLLFLNMVGVELVIVLLFGLPFIIALIDILKHEFTGYNKLIWLIAIILVPFIGAMLYFIIGRKQKITS